MSFDFEIKADPSKALSAADKVDSSLQGIERQADKTGESVSRALAGGQAAGQNAAGQFEAATVAARGAESAAGGVADAMASIAEAAGILVGLHQLEGLVDGYTELSNKIRASTKDSDNMRGVLDALYQTAQDTRSNLDDLGASYQRISNSARSLGLSQQQLIDLTAELAQAGKVGGQSNRDAAQSMSELTHAFATGTLQGREFRVLMRDAPVLMHELQEASGKTGSAFAEMGKHSQITAQDVVKWLGGAADDIKAKFDATTPTIADGFTLIHNAAEKFFGEAGAGSGVLTALASAARFVAANFDTFGKVILGVGQVLVGLFVIEKVIALVKMLGVAIAANPAGALALALVTVVSLLRQFGDQMDAGIDGVTKVSDVLDVMWQDLKSLGAAIETFLTEAWGKLTAAFSDGVDSTGIELSFKNILIFMASFVDAAVGILTAFKEYGVAAFGGMAVAIGEKFVEVAKMIATVFQDMINAVTGQLNKMSASLANQAPDVEMDRMRAKTEADQAGIAYIKSHPGLSTKQYTEEHQDELQNSYFKRGLDENGLIPGSGQTFGKVDFSFNNPLEGAGSDLKDLLKKGLDDARAETVVKDWITDVLQRAAAMTHPVQAPGYVDQTKGTAETPGPTDAEVKAAEKLLNELRAIVEASNPVSEAQEKLAHAQTLVTAAMTSGSPAIKALLAQFGGGVAIMDAYAKKLNDQLHPFDAMVTKLLEQTAALKGTAIEQQHATEMEKLASEAKQKGITLTESQTAELSHLVTVYEEHKKQLAEQQALYTQIVGPAEKYNLQLTALKELWSDGTITDAQYTTALMASRDAFLEASGEAKTFAGGVELAMDSIKKDVVDVGSSIGKTFKDVFDGMNDQIASFVVKGTADLTSFVQTIETDLVKLELKQLEGAAIKGLSSSASELVNGSGSGGGLASIASHAAKSGDDAASVAAAGAEAGTEMAAGVTDGGVAATAELGAGIEAAGTTIAALFTAAGDEVAATLTAAMAAGGGASAAESAAGSAAGAAATAAFSTGGDFNVPGSGTGDSKVVAFRATPGEHVSVESPNGRKSQGGQQDAGARAPVVHTHVHIGEKELVSTLAGSSDFHDMVANIAIKQGGVIALRSRPPGT